MAAEDERCCTRTFAEDFRFDFSLWQINLGNDIIIVELEKQRVSIRVINVFLKTKKAQID